MEEYNVEAAKVRAAEHIAGLFNEALTWDKITIPSWDDAGTLQRWGNNTRKTTDWQPALERGFFETPYAVTVFQPSDGGAGKIVIIEYMKSGEFKFVATLHIQATTPEYVHYEGLMFNPVFEKKNPRPVLEQMAQESGMIYLALMDFIRTQGEPYVKKEEQSIRHVSRDKSDRSHGRKGKKTVKNVVRTNYIVSVPTDLKPEAVSEASRMFDKILAWDKIRFASLFEMKGVSDWAEINLPAVFTDWNPPLFKGHIEIPDQNETPDAFLAFDTDQSDPNYVELMEFDSQGNLHWIGSLDMVKSSPSRIVFENDLLPETPITKRLGQAFIEERINVGVSLYIFVMGYIRANRNTYVTTVKENVERRVSDRPTIPRKYEPSSVVKIQPRTIYRISAPSGGTSNPSGPKRGYTQDSWTVIGHKRRYRDAEGNIIKEIDVAPYTKGQGRHKAKTYQI